MLLQYCLSAFWLSSKPSSIRLQQHLQLWIQSSASLRVRVCFVSFRCCVSSAAASLAVVVGAWPVLLCCCSWLSGCCCSPLWCGVSGWICAAAVLSGLVPYQFSADFGCVLSCLPLKVDPSLRGRRRRGTRMRGSARSSPSPSWREICLFWWTMVDS